MAKCAICGCGHAMMAWQPFGPDPDPTGSFATLGNHYRGFPVVKVCFDCADDIRAGLTVEFEYQGQRYIWDVDGCHAVPDYVTDALLWLEETQEPGAERA